MTAGEAGPVTYERVDLAGGELVVLGGESTLYSVERGSIAVFCAEVRDGVIAGPRRFLYRVGAGKAAVSVASESSRGLCFLVAPVERAVLRRTDLCSGWEGRKANVARLVDGWVGRLARLLDPHGAVRQQLRTAGGEELVLEQNQELCGEREGVVWVDVVRGEACLAGYPQELLRPGEGFFPLGPGMSLQALEECTIDVRATSTLPNAVALEAALRRLHGVVLLHLDELTQREARAEIERLRTRDRIQADKAVDALAELADVVESGERFRHAETPLLTALTAVGESLGVEIRAPAKSGDRRAPDSTRAICDASRLRARRVKLSDRWWTRDCGPLLAFSSGADRRPLALLQTRSGAYEVFDPVDETRTRVDSRTASRVSPEAVMLYRPLPEGPVSLWGLVRFSLGRRKRDLRFALWTGLGATLLAMITPQAIALLMDHGIPDANRRLLTEVGLGLVAATFGVTLFRLSQGLVLIRIGLASEVDGQAAIWDRLLRLRPSFFRRFSSGDLQSRVMAVNDIGREISGATLTTLFSSLLALLNVLLLVYYSPPLALIAVVVGAVVLGVTASAGYLVRRRLRDFMEIDGEIFGLVVQLLDGVGKLRVAGAGGRAYTHWIGRYTKQLRIESHIARLRDRVDVFNQAVPTLSAAVLFFFAFDMLVEARRAGTSGLTLGTFLGFNVAFATFLAGVTSLSGSVVGILDLAARGRRVRPILQEPPEIDATKSVPGPLSGRLELESVGFRYEDDGPQVLDDVSLRAEPEEFIAIVGPSGSGKSTILRLLLGFEKPGAGLIQYDGQDLANLDVLEVRKQLGVVLQDGRVDAGPIFDNIAGGGSITIDEAWAAAEDAGIADEIREMPMGMHTIVSVGGANLSGGQRQRLLIARALARSPRILLLDEATSALDNRTQAIVSASLERLHVTRVVVAHRLSTVRNADRIYVIDGGRVVGEGTFDELMRAEDGLFKSMMTRQLV